jgi:hypothetical protein
MEENAVMLVRVSCPTCGQVKVAPRELTIRNCVETDEWSYCFLCHGCSLRASGVTQRGAALDTVCAGAKFESWHLPAELHERPDAPPLAWVDVLELRLALIEPDWIDRLRQ